MVALEELPGGRRLDLAHDISPDATVIVGAAWGTESVRACRWTELEGIVTLGVLPGYLRSEAYSTSAGGSVIVGSCYCEDDYTAFRWTPDDGMVALGSLPGSQLQAGVAYVVSADGGLIVGEAHADDAHIGMIWTATTGARDLNVVLERDLGVDLDGWTLKEAYGLSSDGRYVVGHGTNPDGGSEAWLAYLGDPIPCRGDIDGDGLRNLADLSVLLTAYGNDDGGDIDGDGDTDLADLGWLLSVYGQPCLQW
jgi:uncharacterized membrane protein